MFPLLLCCEHIEGFQAHPGVANLTFEDRFQQKLAEGRKLRGAGEYEKAERLFRAASQEAEQAQSFGPESQALLLASGCDIRLHRYGVALKTLDAARQIALRLHDSTILGAVASNTTSVYYVLGDSSSAGKTSEESLGYLRNSPRRDYFANALILNGNIQFGLGHVSQGNNSLLQAIQVAKDASLPAIEAFAENELAVWRVLNNNLPEAETLLRRALEVSKQCNDGYDLAETSEHLAEIEWKKGGRELTSALRHIDSALASTDERFKSEPQYYLIHVRAQILLSLGHKDQALSEFRRAVQSADLWRQSALPGDTTNTRTVAQLDSVYKDYAQLAAELSLERDDHALAREAFEVLSRNRAASLREQLTRSYTSKLLDSPEYFDLLQQLQAAQASTTLENDTRQVEIQRQKLDQIRAKLSDLENRIGLTQQNFLPTAEKKEPHSSLKSIQARLNASEALFSFSLGDHKSFLWAVTTNDVRLYDLPNQETIAHQAEAFSRAVSTNSTTKADAGRALSRSLFLNVAPSLKAKRNWLLTPDGALLDKVPFSALPAVFEGSDKPIITNHTIRLLPSASLLQASSRPLASRVFVGVADPIYNLADSRRDRTLKNSGSFISPKPKKSSTTLGRLVASEIEIKSSAEQCGLPQKRMLTGKEASAVSLREATRQPTEILHFAVHVISPKDFPQEAALALSLTKDNLPELLTAESAATFRVPGSLVVLSGCASQQGEVLPGAGLVGLSRGWLLAGAAAVVVSAWPTPDASGSFFPTFYTHYRKASGSVAVRAAIALQQTQIDMQRGAGYESEPSFWAAYSIISKE